MDDDNNQDLIQLGLRNPNPVHRDFFKRFDNSLINGTKSGLYFRLMKFLGDIYLRQTLLGKSTVDIKKEMNEGKVVICNFSKGMMGKESGRLIGKLFLALIQGYASEREGQDYIKPTFVFVDEMQNYVTPSIKDIMAESRKYGVHMILANQVLGQNMSSKLLNLIMSNTAIKMCGDVDPKSAKGMGESMSLKLKDFETLRKFHFFSYNRENKKAGTIKMKVPDNLVAIKPPYYATKKALKDYFLWLAHDSGYYVKTDVEAPQDAERSGGKFDSKPGQKVYPNTFND
jgi:hypothetical protein